MAKQAYKHLKPQELKPYHNNPRNNDGAVEGVAESIAAFGFQQPILVDENHEILAGHTRWKAAIRLELKEVPVVVSSGLSDQQKRAYRIADNKFSERAFWDFEKLQLELEGMEDDYKNLLDFGFEKTEEINNRDDEWADLPEFETAEKSYKLLFHFTTAEDRDNFINDNSIVITKKTNEYAWTVQA